MLIREGILNRESSVSCHAYWELRRRVRPLCTHSQTGNWNDSIGPFWITWRNSSLKTRKIGIGGVISVGVQIIQKTNYRNDSSKNLFCQDLHLPIDLLRGNPPKTEGDSFSENYLGKVKRKLEEIHEGVRKQIDIKSSRTKTWYDLKTRQIYFKEGHKVWLYNPQRKKGELPNCRAIGTVARFRSRIGL